METECKYCKGNEIVRYGTKNNRDTKIQVFRCKSCNRLFSENTTFHRMKHKGEIITVALDLYCKNVSLRRITEHLKLVHNTKVSHVTILNWIRKYSDKFKEFSKNMKVNNGNSIHVDEMMVNVNGKWCWWWQAIDKDTKFLLSTHMSRARELSDAKKVFLEAKGRMNNKPERVVTDGMPSYIKAFNKAFYTKRLPRAKHVRLIHFFDKVNNNVIERAMGSVRERTKIMRGFDQFDSAGKILNLWGTYYNFIRPHQTLGTTPSEAAGSLKLNGGNRWMELIELASKAN